MLPQALKRTGHFWSTIRDEALITLETMWRNQRCCLLFPSRQLLGPPTQLSSELRNVIASTPSKLDVRARYGIRY
jgi:hypothetical protein